MTSYRPQTTGHRPQTAELKSFVHRPSSVVELHIEQLVLHGFPPGERYGIAEAVERELTRLLAEQGVPAGLEQAGAVARLDGGSSAVIPDAQPEALGRQIAQAVYRGFGR